MQTSQNQPVKGFSAQAMAKFAIGRPCAAMRELMALDKAERNAEIQALRVYPAALIALYRADNAPVDVRIILSDELESAGFKMMT